MKLKNKVAIVTGSGQNVGKEIVLLFSKNGAKVVVVGRDDQKGLDVKDEIIKSGGEAIYVHCDVTNPEEVKKLISITMIEYKKIDILINNVGYGIWGKITDQTIENWHKIINANLNSAFYCSKFALEEMLKNKDGGVIVNISSIDGLVSAHGLPSYDAAKAGLINLTRSIALDYAENNIRANAICPGQIKQKAGQSEERDKLFKNIENLKKQALEAVPMGRLCEPIEVAKAALFLVSDDSSYITGTTWVIDGGLLARSALPKYSKYLK